MKLLMISGDRHVLEGKQGAFWYTLQEMAKYWDRIDVITPPVKKLSSSFVLIPGGYQNAELSNKIFFHPSQVSLWRHSNWINLYGQALIQEFHHDIITVHEYPPFYNGKGARALSQKTGVPAVYEIHHIVGYPVAASFSEWVGQKLSRYSLAKVLQPAKAVRTVNQSVADTLVSWGVPREKIQVVPSFYLDESILQRDLEPPKIYDLAFCARLVGNKGLEEVLRAVSQMRNASLVVIGEGPKREQYQKLARTLGITSQVKFLGWLPNLEAVIGIVLSARIFVNNSKSEGGPRSALEAMASGMPVLTTRTGVMPEVIEDGRNGVFIDGTAKDLATKAFQLLQDDEARKRMGQEAKKILHTFDRTTLVQKYAEFLQSHI